MVISIVPNQIKQNAIQSVLSSFPNVLFPIIFEYMSGIDIIASSSTASSSLTNDSSILKWDIGIPMALTHVYDDDNIYYDIIVLELGRRIFRLPIR